LKLITFHDGVINLNYNIRNGKIYNINYELGLSKRNIIKNFTKTPNLMPFIERISPYSSWHYCICYADFLEDTIRINKNLKNVRTLLLEIERVSSHINYLNAIFKEIKNIYLYNSSLIIKEKILSLREGITGHRIFGTYNLINSLNYDFNLGCIDLVKDFYSITKVNSNSIIKNIKKHKNSLSKLEKLGIVKNYETGPFIEESNDLRIKKPYLAYKEPKIQSILKNRIASKDFDAKERVLIIINEIFISLEIIKILLKEHDLIFNKSKKTYDGTISSDASIETPRGLLSISKINEKEIRIITPSERNIHVLKEALSKANKEDDKLIIKTLYLSTLEYDK
jgi:Ni,Fe-hydrogenase III large subunit